MLLAEDPGEVNWYKQYLWTAANICDFGQQGDLYKKRLFWELQRAENFKTMTWIQDLCHPHWFVPYMHDPRKQAKVCHKIDANINFNFTYKFWAFYGYFHSKSDNYETSPNNSLVCTSACFNNDIYWN